MRRLENRYHSKFRPRIFKQLTATQYNALAEAANCLAAVPEDVIGAIWMFVQPFDQLIELKFAVDTINAFFDSGKHKIDLKKLPIQSHRGYELEHIL